MLEVKNLEVQVGGKKILKGINLTVRAGEIHAIMGPNGSGKSTLAKALTGHSDCEIVGGEAIYCGENLLAMEPEERAQKGFFLAFQQPIEIAGVANTEFLKTALNEIRSYQGLKPLSFSEFRSRLKEKIDLFKIGADYLGRSVNEGFSGGEKKRSEILQLALLEPKLALLDETDSGLDIDALRIVAEGVNSLKDPRRAFIVITHFPRFLNYLVPDYVHILVDGQIVRSGGKDLAAELESKGYSGIGKDSMEGI